MDLAIGFIGFLLGLLIGMGAVLLKNRMESGNQNTKQMLATCQQEKAQMKQDWQDNLATFRAVATNLQDISEQINAHVNESEKLLHTESNAPSFPFFSKEATQILQNAGQDGRQNRPVSDQPLDYSGGASGVFTGNPHSVKTAKEAN
jgi:uncharacterized membrane-anchored protein YhcB (DUF1043 family)